MPSNPKDLVERLLSEANISAFVNAVQQLLTNRPNVKWLGADVMEPENVAEVSLSVHGRPATYHVSATADGYEYLRASDAGEYEGDFIKVRDAAGFLGHVDAPFHGGGRRT
jgi:hypothetical protein